MRRFNRHVFAAVVASLVLAACGGGGGSGSEGGGEAEAPKTGPTAEGVYAGTLTGGTSDSFELVVLENDEFWAVYGDNVPGVFLVSGFIQGTGKSNNGAFTSSDTKDFGVVPATNTRLRQAGRNCWPRQLIQHVNWALRRWA